MFGPTPVDILSAETQRSEIVMSKRSERTNSMLQKSTLPKAEVAVCPIPTRIADQGDEREPVAPIEPQVSPLTEGAEGVETYQADRALHAMLTRLSSGISPAALLLAYTDWLSHLASSPQRRIEIAQEALIDTKRFFEASQRFF